MKPRRWMCAYPSGNLIDFDAPRPDSIDIRDVAHHLSLICRYVGGVPTMYSVAQHSVIVSLVAPVEWDLEALMHDAPEAYVGDMTHHLKRMLDADNPLPGTSPPTSLFSMVHDGIEAAIWARFPHLKPGWHPHVGPADYAAYEAEVRDLFPKTRDAPGDERECGATREMVARIGRIEPWTSTRAEKEFLDRWERLSRIRGVDPWA